MKKYECRELIAEVERSVADYFTWVPDTGLSEIGSHFNAVTCADEFIALCVGVGAHFAGRDPAVFMQNSGFWGAANAVTGLCALYDIFPWLFVQMRNTPAQHELDGRVTPEVLRSIYSAERLRMISDVEGVAHQPGKGTCFSPGPDRLSPFEECDFGDGSFHVVSLGYQSRNLMQRIGLEHPVLYLTGAMGCAVPVGIGIAHNLPNVDVHVHVGDGSWLMRLGVISLLQQLSLPNLRIDVHCNGSYESTGGQPCPHFPLIQLPGVTYMKTPTSTTGDRPIFDYSAIYQRTREFLRPRIIDHIFQKMTGEDGYNYRTTRNLEKSADYLMEFGELDSTHTILDVGCGEFHLGSILRQRGLNIRGADKFSRSPEVRKVDIRDIGDHVDGMDTLLFVGVIHYLDDNFLSQLDALPRSIKRLVLLHVVTEKRPRKIHYAAFREDQFRELANFDVRKIEPSDLSAKRQNLLLVRKE